MSGSIVQNKKECFLCGEKKEYGYNRLELHHCFGGVANRKLSDKYGLVVWLCGETCHRNGPNAVHKNRESDLIIKRAAQRAFEKDHTREEFIRVFGKSYIW